MILRIFFLIAGALFGYVLIMSGVSNFNVIHDMFLFKSIHLYGLLGIAVGVSFMAVQIIKRLKIKALLSGEIIEAPTEKPTRDHWIGGLLAGAGWAVTGACPGPALAQIGFGTLAGIFTVAGIFIGVYVYGRSQSS